jgi:16S rRNA (guanine1516-N2)-methyltransferase
MMRPMANSRPRPAAPATDAGSSAAGLIGVRPAGTAEVLAARELARELGVACLDSVDVADGLVLVRHPDRIELRDGFPGAGGCLCVDFLETHARRGSGASWRKDPLARAVGLRRHGRPTVLDATLGLGRDAWLLAALGCRVLGCERSPVVRALVSDGLSRAAGEPAVAGVLERLAIHPGDARPLLAQLRDADRPAVVTLDPMFPERRKSARVRKEMHLLQKLLGQDEDAPALLEQALGAARERVVVKRPRGAPPLEGPRSPSFVVEGRSLRLDVYLVAPLPTR